MSFLEVVMVVFLTTMSGETGHLMFKYSSFPACEQEKELVINRLQNISENKEDKDKLDTIIAVCIKSPTLTRI